MSTAPGRSAYAGWRPPLRDFLRETRVCIAALSEAIRVLPAVDDDGQSACPVAERLHCQMERHMEALQGCKGELHRRLAETQAEIRRCEKNRSIVADHQCRLRGADARDHYASADESLARQYSIHLQSRDEILEVLEEVDNALEASYGRLFPGRKPQDCPEPAQTFRTEGTAVGPPLIGKAVPNQEPGGPVEVERAEGAPGWGGRTVRPYHGTPARAGENLPGPPKTLRAEPGGPQQHGTAWAAPKGELADILGLETQRGKGRQPAVAPLAKPHEDLSHGEI